MNAHFPYVDNQELENFALMKVNSFVRTISDITSAVLFSTLLLLLFFSVLARGLVHLPTPWLEEVGSLLCIYFVAFSAISAWIRSQHIAVDIIPNMMRGNNRIRYQLLLDMIGVVFFTMAAIGSFNMMSKSLANHTTVLGISYYWYYLGVATAFGGILLTTLVRIISIALSALKK